MFTAQKLVECDFCHKDFKRGKGHMCWCPDCKKGHPMCNKCYKEHKSSMVTNIFDISEDNKDKYT